MASTSEQGLDTPQVQFVLRFLDHLSSRNLDAAFSLLSDTLVYELWPASLAHAPRTKSEYKAFLETSPDRDLKVPPFRCDRTRLSVALTYMIYPQFEIVETVESPGKVVAHVSCRVCSFSFVL